MSIYEPNNSGTVQFTNGATAIVGTGTTFASYRAGSVISIPGVGEMQLAGDPTSDTAAVGIVPWQGADTGPKPFQYIPRNEQANLTQKLAALLTALGNGNLQAVASLTGAAQQLIMFTGAGALGVVNRSELIQGLHSNAQVEDMPGRAAYDNKPGPSAEAPGFSVFVNDVGDGRGALFFKMSNATADWSAPAYTTGSQGIPGPFTNITFGDVTTGAPGTPASVTVTPVGPGVVRLDFEVPAGHDGVDGVGDVVGPAVATAKRLAVFANAGGKNIDIAAGMDAAQQGQARIDIGAGAMGPYRNKARNHRFLMAQRGTTFSAAGMTVDGWQVLTFGTGATGTSVQVFRNNAVAISTGRKDLLSFDRTGGTSIARLQQKIEGVETLAGRTVTLALYAYSGVGTIDITTRVDQDFGTGGSGVVGGASKTHAIPIAPVIVYHTFTMPSIASKTIGTHDCIHLIIDSPAAGAFGLRLLDVALVDGDCTGEGETIFSPRDIPTEILLNQRFYQKSYEMAVAPGTVSSAGTMFVAVQASFNYAGGSWVLPTRMRASPTVTIYSPGSGATGKGSLDGVDKDVVGQASDARLIVYLNNQPAVANQFLNFHYTLGAEFPL